MLGNPFAFCFRVMKKKNKSSLVSLSLLAVLIPFTVSGAQIVNTQGSSIIGTTFVIDQSGNQSCVPNASVVLRGPVSATTNSDAEGRYSFHSLPSGTYTIIAHLPGLEAAETVSTKRGETSEVPLQLKLIEVKSAVHVTASMNDANVARPAPNASIGESTLRNAPNVDERFQSMLPLVPGVVRRPDGRINLKGARESQSGALINGADVTDPATGLAALNIPIDAVSSVKVLSSPYDPQYGKLTGALSSVETRTSNYDRFHFSMQNIVPRLRVRDNHVMGIGAATPRTTITGPLIKGRLAITQSFEYRHVYTPVNSLPYDARDTKLESFNSYTQVDAILSQKQTATFALVVYPQKLKYFGLNTFTPQPSTSDLHQRGYEIYAQHTYLPSDQSSVTSQIAYQTFDFDLTAESDRPYRLLIDTTEGGAFNRQARRSSRTEWLETYQVSPWHFWGTHHFEVGFNYSRSLLHGHDAFLPVQILGENSVPIEQLMFTQPGSFSVSRNEGDVYWGDRWSMTHRLTVRPGLRFDTDSVTGSNHAAPRIGFVLALTSDGKTLLKGGIGVFYDRIPLLFPAFDRLPSRTVSMLDTLGATAKSISYSNEITGRLRNPRSTSWNAELDRQLTGSLILQVAYEQRNTADAVTLSPAGYGSSEILSLSSSGTSSYREFQITGRYKTGHNLWFASYTHSQAYGDLNDFFDFFGSAPQPVVQPDVRARLPYDAPDRLLFWGDFSAPLKLSIAPVVEVHTGFPYSIMNQYRDFVSPRNARRFPRFSSVDLEITRRVSLPFGQKRFHARVGGGVFNLFNHDNPRDIQNDIDSLQFGRFFNSAWREYKGKFVVEF